MGHKITTSDPKTSTMALNLVNEWLDVDLNSMREEKIFRISDISVTERFAPVAFNKVQDNFDKKVIAPLIINWRKWLMQGGDDEIDMRYSSLSLALNNEKLDNNDLLKSIKNGLRVETRQVRAKMNEHRDIARNTPFNQMKDSQIDQEFMDAYNINSMGKEEFETRIITSNCPEPRDLIRPDVSNIFNTVQEDILNQSNSILNRANIFLNASKEYENDLTVDMKDEDNFNIDLLMSKKSLQSYRYRNVTPENRHKYNPDKLGNG